jgi:hypothetical protein
MADGQQWQPQGLAYTPSDLLRQRPLRRVSAVGADAALAGDEDGNARDPEADTDDYDELVT